MVPASDRLYRIVGKRITLSDNEEATSARSRRDRQAQPPRWRIDKANRADNVDGIVALCMALESAEAKPEPVELLGWL
jgi:hypothetical protein